MSSTSEARPQADLRRCAEVADSCMNFGLRKVSRLVGGLYDQTLRPSGLRGTQLNLLVALALVERATVKQLAATLVVDRTTLSRNLGPLERAGLVRSVPGRDGRARPLELTDLGVDRLATALEYWQQAQARLIEVLGPGRSTPACAVADMADQIGVCTLSLRRESGHTMTGPDVLVAGAAGGSQGST